MSEQFETHGNTVRSIRPVRQVLVIEPVQQHHGLEAILLLPGTQCTIGSSRACTLTIRAQAILPQHCLIVSGANSTLLKEWGDSTWLNDRPVRESIELMENDRLAVGPIEFRIRQAHAEEIEAAWSNPSDNGIIDGDTPPTEELQRQRLPAVGRRQRRVAGQGRDERRVDRQVVLVDVAAGLVGVVGQAVGEDRRGDAVADRRRRLRPRFLDLRHGRRRRRRRLRLELHVHRMWEWHPDGRRGL